MKIEENTEIDCSLRKSSEHGIMLGILNATKKEFVRNKYECL